LPCVCPSTIRGHAVISAFPWLPCSSPSRLECLTQTETKKELPMTAQCNRHHHHLQGSGLLVCSDLPVRRTDPSISSVVDFYLFFLKGDSWIFSEGFSRLTFLGYVRSNYSGILVFSVLH
jgi:hypothetical protein